MTITDFLLAQIAEDEAAARAAEREGVYPYLGNSAAEECVGMARNEGCAEAGAAHLDRWLPGRALAECEAKRRIVALHPLEEGDGEVGCRTCNWTDDHGFGATGPCETVRALAAVYADHPEHREEWS